MRFNGRIHRNLGQRIASLKINQVLASPLAGLLHITRNDGFEDAFVGLKVTPSHLRQNGNSSPPKMRRSTTPEIIW